MRHPSFVEGYWALVIRNSVSFPGDNVFLECADKAGADYLITGNSRHFPKFWKKTKIITAREFVNLAAPHLIS